MPRNFLGSSPAAELGIFLISGRVGAGLAYVLQLVSSSISTTPNPRFIQLSAVIIADRHSREVGSGGTKHIVVQQVRTAQADREQARGAANRWSEVSARRHDQVFILLLRGFTSMVYKQMLLGEY